MKFETLQLLLDYCIKEDLYVVEHKDGICELSNGEKVELTK